MYALFSKLRNTFKYVFDALSSKTISEKDLEDVMFEWQLKLIECDVAFPVAEYITNEVKKAIVGLKVRRFGGEVANKVKNAIKTVLLNLIESSGKLNFMELVYKHKEAGIPLKVVFVGVNGSGKTTTIAKIAYMLKQEKILSVLACSDTFRAGAQEQLATHAKRLGLKMIKHQYGADPAAVAYDAVNYASAHSIPVVLIDTAGRMQTDKGLMDELRKIIRVIEADLIIFIGDALAGNDALLQAEKFNEAVGINASIITKVDADVKGGTALSILYATKKPIIYLGVGQKYEDLIPFTPDWLLSLLIDGK